MKNNLVALMLVITLLCGTLPLINTSNFVAHATTYTDYANAIKKTADRLVVLQSSIDYGWDWDVTGLTSHTANPSATNIYGVTALGLLQAYQEIGNSTYLTAAMNAANFMMYGNASNGDFYNGYGSYNWGYSSDYVFLMGVSAVSGNSSFATYAIAAWAWQKANRNQYYGDGNQTALWNHYRDDWIGTNMSGAAAFGTSDWGLAALAMGDTVWAQQMAAVIHTNTANILTADVTSDYKDMGMGQALSFLVTLGNATYATDITQMKTQLLSPTDLLSDGSWGYGPPPPGDPQTTAYVVMGMLAAGNYTAARNGADWLLTNQMANGGWNIPSYGEFSEPDSEPMQGVLAVYSAAQLYVSPTPVTKAYGDIGTSFTVDIKVQNIEDLFGFDINITWDNTLISFVNCIYNTTMDTVWPSGWYVQQNTTGVNGNTGWCRLVAVSTSSGFTTSGSQTLFTLQFHTVNGSNVATLQTPIHFAAVAISDSHWTAIPASKVDGLYQITPATPSIVYQLTNTPTQYVYGKTFQLQVNVTNIYSQMTGYSITITYDTELFNYVSIDWTGGVLGTGTCADSPHGTIVAQVTGASPWTGNNGLLFTLTFQVQFDNRITHIWRTGQPHELTRNISLPNAQLTFTDGTLSSGSISLPTSLSITVHLIQGDVNCDGKVDIFDLQKVAQYYDKTSSDPSWTSTIQKYDLNNDGSIDLYDLVIVATNFGYGIV